MIEIGVQRPALEVYLARLDAAAAVAGLPADRRAELLQEIRGHVDDALAGVLAPTEAALADVIDRLGGVDEIVAAELVAGPAPEPGPASASAPASAPAPTAAPAGPSSWVGAERPVWGPLEVTAVAGLTIGSYLVPVVGTLVGLVCAWISPRWTTRQKSIATALSVVPAMLILVAGVALFAARSVSVQVGPATPVSTGVELPGPSSVKGSP